MYLENWRAWEELRGQLIAQDPRRFHVFADGRLFGSYGRYYAARHALTTDDQVMQGMIVKWMDIAFERLDRVLIDVYWRGDRPEADGAAGDQAVATVGGGADGDRVLIARLLLDYPAEWEDHYAVVADGVIQGLYDRIRPAQGRVASLEGIPTVYIVSVGPPRPSGDWVVKLVEAFYLSERRLP